MRLPCVRFTVRRLMLVVTAMGLNFGVAPWPACGVMAAVIALPLFVSLGTLLDWVVLYGFAGLLAVLSLPAVGTHCRLRMISSPPVSPSTAGVPIAVPTNNGHVVPETPGP